MLQSRVMFATTNVDDVPWKVYALVVVMVMVMVMMMAVYVLVLYARVDNDNHKTHHCHQQ
jgi:heme/copper-type cytochrome/quinol oxidase subunit 2